MAANPIIQLWHGEIGVGPDARSEAASIRLSLAAASPEIPGCDGESLIEERVETALGVETVLEGDREDRGMGLVDEIAAHRLEPESVEIAAEVRGKAGLEMVGESLGIFTEHARELAKRKVRIPRGRISP